ncbi:hypothetical protein CIY_28940 [Butyrivibrio fibrisolvens 16/4]|nr:hypothetical protein CIY_28940 [Butyrivibrio fibrisolvens 16/4]
MAEKVLEINDIYKRKRTKKILQGVTFDVGEQEIVCLLAPNGSGKTTIIKCVTGLFKLNKGSISICGHDIKRNAITHIRILDFVWKRHLHLMIYLEWII